LIRGHGLTGRKVFWFFFSKKNRLLARERKRFFLKKEAKTSIT
jgi:hypothetical protein